MSRNFHARSVETTKDELEKNNLNIREMLRACLYPKPHFD